MSKHGWISPEELKDQGAVMMSNHEGQRVWVWPLFSMHGEWHYPLVHLPYGEERRRREAAMSLGYKEYRDQKKKKGSRSDG